MPDDPDDYATPDLVVLPDAWDEDDEWLADPADVELAVEVISVSERAHAITEKIDWYATARVQTLLVLDPRRGTWALHTHRKDGSYHGTLSGDYGEQITLPAPLGLPVSTGHLPLYGEGKTTG
jgi:Uma2 family endonuclease